MWALTDFTEENGATHIVPGSSTMDDEAGLAVADGAGDDVGAAAVLFYDGQGAPRRWREPQSTLIAAASTSRTPWAGCARRRTSTSPRRPRSPRTLDDDLLRMMGYQQGAFALGYVGDQEDPLAHLRGTSGKVKVIGDIVQRNDDIRTFVEELAVRALNNPRSVCFRWPMASSGADRSR